MTIPVRVLNMVLLVPALVSSMLLAVVMCALLPPALGLLALMTAAGLLIAVALGHLRTFAIGMLTRSRLATRAELHALTLVLAELDLRGVTGVTVFVRRTQRSSTPVAEAAPDRAVVVTPGLVNACHENYVTPCEGAAVIAHAIARHHALQPRSGLVTALVLAPWRLLLAVLRSLGRVFAWLPLAGMAWKLRGVVGSVCVAHAVAEGPAAPGLIGGLLVAMTYGIPAAHRLLESRIEAAADRWVVSSGLGAALSELHRRYHHPVSLAQAQRLTAPPPQQQPVQHDPSRC